MRCAVDVEAQRIHAAGILARALQRHAERRAQQVLDEEIAGERPEQREIVVGNRLAEIDVEHDRRMDLVEALVSAEDRVVLLRQVVEGHADRQRDHDRIDAFGAHREPADEGGEQGRDRHADRHRDPPRPAQAAGAALRLAGNAEDRHHVAGETGDRHLGQRDHAAIAAEEGEREGDQAEHQRLAADLIDEERRGDPGVDQDGQQDGDMAHADGAQRAGDRLGGARPRCRRRRAPAGPGVAGDAGRARPGVAARARIHRPAPLGGAHALLRPRMPFGRKASTSTMIRKVKTTP